MADTLPPSGQTPELSLGGLSLLYDKDHQAADFLRKYQPLDDLIAQVDHAIHTENSKSSSVGPSHIGLPRPNYPPAPPPRINQLYWPTGAVRWARGYFLASSTVAVELSNQSGTALPFVARVNEIELKTDLYCLAPRPVSCVEGGYDTLFLIPVVDERYWWQFRNYGDKGIPELRGMSWTDLLLYVVGRLGIASSGGILEYGTIDSAYLKPDPEEFTRRYDNAAYLLDAIAHSVGQRIVRQFDGTVGSMTWDKAIDHFDENTATRIPWWQIAGDKFELDPVPDSVYVLFPKVICGTPTANREFHRYIKSVSTFNGKVTDTVKTIHSTAWANFVPNSATPSNDSELDMLATAIAGDYSKSLNRYHDRTFDGIKEWFFTGFDDHLLFSFGAEDDEKMMTARTSVDTDDVEPVASTELDCTYQTGYFTRCQAMPGNFGVDEMWHQGSTKVVIPDSGAMWAEGILTADMCPSDSDSDQVVQVTSVTYLPNCQEMTQEQLALIRVVNPRHHRGPVGAKVLMVRKTCPDEGQGGLCEWQIVDVELRKYCPFVYLKDNPSCLVGAGLRTSGEWCLGDEPILACKIVEYIDCDTTLPPCDQAWIFDPLFACCGQLDSIPQQAPSFSGSPAGGSDRGPSRGPNGRFIKRKFQ